MVIEAFKIFLMIIGAITLCGILAVFVSFISLDIIYWIKDKKED